MDVQNKLDEIVAAIENARSMPMSASCVVNRSELIALLQDLQEALPSELSQAQAVVAGHEQVVAEARAEADRIIHGAHTERGSLISDTEVVLRSQAEADRILAEARAEAEELRRESDDYVDSKLANFEVVLTKTLGAVGRGREKLLGHGPDAGGEYGQGVYGDDGGGEEFQPQTSPSPEVDEYVDVKLATLETVLSKTLEAVGRGRDKLLGKHPVDELGAYLAAADEAQQHKDRAAAVAAGFAADEQEAGADGAGVTVASDAGQAWFHDGTAQQQAVPQQAAQQQGWPGEQQDPAAAGWPQGDPYAAAAAHGAADPAYTQVYGGGYDPVDPYAVQQSEGYGYQEQGYTGHDPYAAQAGGSYPQQGQDGSGYAQQPGYAPQDAYGSYGYQQQVALPQQQGGAGSLDETSFFDTSVIDLARLRELGGR